MTATAHAEGAYRFTDLGALGDRSIGYAINRHGSVAGMSITGSAWSATLWHHGKTKALENPKPGWGKCEARGINGKAAVVGHCFDADGANVVLWQGGMPTVLPTLGGVASDINQAGWVVGSSIVGISSENVFGPLHATMWIDGAPTDLGTLPGGAGSQAVAINDKGDVAGSSDNRDNWRRATVWRGTKVIDLGTLGGRYSDANALNGRGQVVGSSETAGGDVHAALWDGKAVTDLGTLPGGTYSEAIAINDAGVTVGLSFVTEAREVLDQRATIWKGGAIIDLNTLLDDETRAAGWLLLSARAINDHGVITGVATNTIVHTSHAFLLTPPAP